MPQLCPNCALSDFLPQLCPDCAPTVPKCFQFCAPTVPQLCPNCALLDNQVAYFVTKRFEMNWFCLYRHAPLHPVWYLPPLKLFAQMHIIFSDNVCHFNIICRFKLQDGGNVPFLEIILIHHLNFEFLYAKKFFIAPLLLY